MKRPLIIIFSVIGVFLIISISLMGLFGPRVGNTFSTVSRDLGYGGGGGAPEVGYAPVEAPAAHEAYAADQSTASNVAQQVERMVIENVDLSIVVKDPEVRKEEISALAREMGGYVVSSYSYKSTTSSGLEAPAANLVLRVPNERLNEALERIKAGAVDVQYENRSGQDVTDQYVNLGSRLKAKQIAEKKLIEIMEQADDTEDVLAVYIQLQQIQSEIEVLTGQIKYLEESVALSSISVQLIAEATLPPLEVGGWRLDTTATEAWENLKDFVKGFTRLLIQFLVFVLPATILVGATIYGFFLGGRAVFRRFSKSRVKPESEEVMKK